MLRTIALASAALIAVPAFCAETHTAATGVSIAQADSPRRVVSLDGPGWRVWLDEKAQWKNDDIHAPGEVPPLAQLPVNAPTGGWETLNKAGANCSLPAYAEEIFSGGKRFWTYHGVMWFWKELEVPADWRGKVVRLDCGGARLRVELYVNGTLAGYDVCAETPFAFDISPYLKPGAKNQIAFRVTNPGGSFGEERGFGDYPMVAWGDNDMPGADAFALNKQQDKFPLQAPSAKYRLPPSHDFGGIAGSVGLSVSEPVFIEDVFVKNLLPVGARKVEAQIVIRNTTSATVRTSLAVAVPGTTAKAVLEKVELKPGENRFTVPLQAPEAKLWDAEHPNLYACRVVLSETGAKETDRLTVDFGFRVFEAKEVAGQKNWYLNGTRIRHRSAIDWGFYAKTGNRATPEMARRSVENAKAIGHNGLNFHRHIGEPLVMKYADELGLYLYEEPGGFRCNAQECDVSKDPFASKVMAEKVRRMVLRDRNHPSLLMYCMANEDGGWAELKKNAMLDCLRLDGSRLVIANSACGFTPFGDDKSGSMFTGKPTRQIPIIRPYATDFSLEHYDPHTIWDSARFDDKELAYTPDQRPGEFTYFGEVRDYAGPSNWPLCAALTLPDDRPGYDADLYRPMADKLDAFFKDCRLADTGSRIIKTPADITVQAGRSLMYINGRVSQSHMIDDATDGYAINGWSTGPQLRWTWDSGICDQGRNLKGPAADYAYWTRTPQVSLRRQNGKTFEPGQTVKLESGFIVEGKVPAGNYTLRFTATDGAGRLTAFRKQIPVKLKGGDVFAQRTGIVEIVPAADWRAGHITVIGELLDAGGRVVADGKEQFLLRNRPSWKSAIANEKIAVTNWPAADAALKDAGAGLSDENSARIILAGSPPGTPGKPDADLAIGRLLERAKSGATLVIRFDATWAGILHKREILGAPVTQWGGIQERGWNGNGWGYLDHFIGGQAVPSNGVVGLNSWEAPGEPRGFWPFTSALKHNAYGAYLARPQGAFGMDGAFPNVLVLLGTIDYGRGKIILAPSYPVDGNNAFNDMLFFNMILQASKKNW